MILSISRRTDIPAFYSDWFFNRVHEGFCYIQNPMNPKQIQKVLINPELVDAMVFWTKNPQTMLSRLNELEEYPYYFQVTITSYSQDIEAYLPHKKYIIGSFQALAEKIGKNRVIWRYDPILLNEKYTVSYHIKYFEVLAKALSTHTEKVIFSFIDYYKKIANNWKKFAIEQISETDKIVLAQALSAIAHSYGLKIETCCEELELHKYGINPSKCININLLEEIAKCKFSLSKDTGQRLNCGCVQSVDIGMYNSCRNGCKYCYASFSDASIDSNIKKHNVSSPLLIGEPNNDIIIKDKIQKSAKENSLISLL